MEFFDANDGCRLAYLDTGPRHGLPMILLHGWTGSSAVFKRNIPSLSKDYRVIAPDLRGHGQSIERRSGYHVSRLAMDLRNLIRHLQLPIGKIIGVGASLGCAVLWSYSELFTTDAFSRMIFVDQAPLQNYTTDGSWGPEYGSKGCNSAESLARLEQKLKDSPLNVYKGTVADCLGYRSHPLSDDMITDEEKQEDEEFFVNIALQGDPVWYGKLMADHTALDWRDSIKASFNPEKSHTTVLVIATDRSGCFPAQGPAAVVRLVEQDFDEERADAVLVEWGGHWCYWENPAKFNELVLDYLKRTEQ
ncbi:MAG: hypothetical protein MMC33_003991 [Icmadophila ericetorum]|nr:hypothetical protein [Icmadophila ericetorum]